MSEDPLKLLLNRLAEMFDGEMSVSVTKIIEINTSCPYCDKQLNGTVNIGEGGEPEAGSPSICSECYNISHFDENLQLVQYTPETWQVLGEGYQRFLREKRQEIMDKEG